MTTEQYCLRSTVSRNVLLNVMLCLMGIAMMTTLATAQQRYSYLPTASVTDGRFLSIAGAGINTLGDNTLTFKITSPGAAASVEIGIFDGETGGMWDQGTVPLQFTLYADPTGDGSGTTQVGQWSGASMADNAWHNITVTNPTSALSAGGDYFYILRVTSSNAAAFSWSSFKLRTNGSLAGCRNTSFAYTAPIASQSDASVIYPNWPVLTTTNYDGNWDFYLDVRTPLTSLALWDGDMDRGTFDCQDNDVDDEDTPNGVIPNWAAGTASFAEGIASGGSACVDANGNTIPGTTTSNPPDNSRNGVFRRGNGVSYELVLPNGKRFANNNPSGNLEWEQFKIDVAPFNRSTMDYHADSIPAGVYRLQISGVDLSNLNAWRFPVDFLGVDSNGVPVLPPPPDVNDGVIEGTIFVDANSNSVQDPGEPGLPNKKIFFAADYNNDGIVDNVVTLTTDNNGKYRVSDLRGGKYTATVDTTVIGSGMIQTFDSDGLATRHRASALITSTVKSKNLSFAYMPLCAPGAATRGYWRNHPEAWPVTSLVLGSKTYTKNEALAILKKSTSGDKTYSMAAQLIATKLNLLRGNGASCIGATVIAADAWLALNPIGQGCSFSDWVTGSPLHSKLDDYNNGELCVPHRDEVDCSVQNAPAPGEDDDDDRCRRNHRHNRNCRDNDDDDDDRDGRCGRFD